MTQQLRFPEWYYGGPYHRIANPDRDLPRRDHATPITPGWKTRTETDGMIEGERLVAPFHDANSVADILGEISHAEGYPDEWDEGERYLYPTIQGAISKLALRVETKLRHNPGRVRTNWFSLALDSLRRAAELFASRDYERAIWSLRQARDLIEQGNHASRRKTSFIVGPDGTAQRA